MDREKVIKGLEHCKKYGSLGGNDCNGHYEYTDNLQEIIKANNHRKDCPYGQCRTGCVVTLVGDALALLKEQQEQIEQMNYIYGFIYGGQVKEIKKLVRCNECKHRDPEDHKCDCGHDIRWQLPRADDWFCADGEEK